MSHPLTSLFLAQSYRDIWDDYCRSLAASEFAHWDYIILTASNEPQAEGFRVQLDERRAAGLLPTQTHFAVISDRGGKRIGSGGATLGAIRYVAEREARSDFSALRILVIHSGGDSKRVPQYSALGKLFSPVPRLLPNGRTSTLFDELLIAMSSVATRVREGMLLLSGDVLLLFNPLQIDYSGQNAAAISFKEPVEVGKDHGVFLRNEDGFVERFLHKQTVESLRACGAVNAKGCVDIDTGAIIFSSQITASLYGLIATDGVPDEEKYDRFVNEQTRLSLYGDFLYPLAAASTWEGYERELPEGAFTPELREARRAVWEVLHPYRLELLRLAPAKFLHFGTTAEIMELMNGGVEGYRDLGWDRHVNSSIRGATSGYSSVLTERATVGEGCYLEVSYVHRGAHIGARTVLSYVDLHDVSVPSDVVLHGLKQRDGKFVVRIFGTHDNPKNDVETATFLGTTLRQFMRTCGISPDLLWSDTEERTLWTAALYPACDTVREAVDAALNIYALSRGGGDLDAWRTATRKSLCCGFLDADPAAIVAWNARMREYVRMDALTKLIDSGTPAWEGRNILCSDHLTPIQEQWLRTRLKHADFSESLRLYYYVGVALGGAVGASYVEKSFRTMAERVLKQTANAPIYRADCRIVKDRHMVSLPLRVNFGGGWSDTPPYCYEHGGTVLNAAILLDGRRPVEVKLERIAERKIVLESRDMGVYGEFDRIAPLQATGDPYDPFALQKAALQACGILPGCGGDLGEILDRLGGGFVMRSEVNGVPKGSGLGTSSILSGACVKALFEFTGIPYTEPDLYRHVLCMEQIMSTGGGWQDQVGGLTDGIKYISSLPGMTQELRVTHLSLPHTTLEELNERFALIYTGQRRLARNLLRDVIGRYVGNRPESLAAFNEIQEVAALMRFELERGNVDAFAALLDRHWSLSQTIDAGTSNTLIDQILASVDDLISGRMICGAGGGGFLQVILKRGVKKDQVSKRLRTVFEDNGIDVWDCKII